MMKKYALLFFLIMFLIGTDTFLVSPLLPTLSQSYGISTSISGWMVSAYALGYAAFALVSGPFSDGRNRKQVLIYGLMGFGLATFLCGFAVNFQLMLLFRFLAGMCASFVTPQVWASIPIVSTKEKMVKMMGVASAGLAVSQLVGVPIGSYLAVVSWQLPFFVIAVAAGILAVAIFHFLPTLNSQNQKPISGSFVKIYGDLLRNPFALKYLGAYLIFQTGNFAIMTFMGSWLTRDFHLTVASVGTALMALGAGNLIGTLFGNLIITRWGLSKSLKRGLLALCLLYLWLPWASSLWTVETLLILAFVVNGFVFPIFMTTLQSTTTTARSTISSFANAAMYVGTTLGGIVGGVLFTKFSGFFGISYFAIIMYFLVWIIYRVSGLFNQSH